MKGLGAVLVSWAKGPARERVILCHCRSSPEMATEPSPSGADRPRGMEARPRISATRADRDAARSGDEMVVMRIVGGCCGVGGSVTGAGGECDDRVTGSESLKRFSLVIKVLVGAWVRCLYRRSESHHPHIRRPIKRSGGDEGRDEGSAVQTGGQVHGGAPGSRCRGGWMMPCRNSRYGIPMAS